VTKPLAGVVASFAQAATHEGAAAFDFSGTDPLTWLVFTKGATLFTDTFYRTQVDELFAYSKALLAAEAHERGFGWKYAAYVRDPKLGKGNRIQGTVAPAVLAAADPDGPHTAAYVAKCLRHRADDVAVFATHFPNLGIGEVPSAARKGMADALAQMDEYQILKYASRQFPLAQKRENRERKSLRLADAMGLAKEYLNPDLRQLYEYLHAPTREKTAKAEGLPLASARRRFFAGCGTDDDFAAGRLSTEQALSFLGSTREAWERVLAVPGLLPDIAFKQYARAMHKAGLPVEFLVAEASRRKFAGLWPHQVYAGYQAVTAGVARPNPHKPGIVVYAQEADRDLVPVFDAILDRVAAGVLPDGLNMGIADVSGSMTWVKLGGSNSSATPMDAAVLFSAMMAQRLGYAATFSDTIFVDDREAGESPFAFADRLKRGQGGGSTQVAGSVVSLIRLLLRETDRPRPRTLYFFSDMQFHPAEQQTIAQSGLPAAVKAFFTPNTPPLLAALRAYQSLLGPVDVVLWNLASYDNAPLPSGMDGVLMLAGFDANSFRHVTTWQASGSPGTFEKPAGEAAVAAVRDPQAELEYIRGF
jgi:hypothetical protein